jgi:signal transduction histidine kinase/CheY-like chemotaxis protein
VDHESTLQKVAQLAVPFFADWCVVHTVADDGELRQLAAAHVDPEKARWGAELTARYRPKPDATAGAGHVFRTGRSELWPEVPDSFLAALARDQEHLRLLHEAGLRSCLCVPLSTRDRKVGTITFLFAESGRRYGASDLAVAEDLACRAAIAIENARLYGELREADRRKDEFLAMLAHELRNPLAPIRSGLDLLAMSGVEIDLVALMQQQVEQLVRLVDDLLDVSRIMRGRLQLRPEPVDLASVVQRAVEASRPSIESHRHALTVSFPPDPIHLSADPVRLAQVFINLLTNSAKYTEEGGRIVLSVCRDAEGVIVSVRDNGMGISPELLPRVFDLFTQADRSLERSQGGLGIGLTLVRRLVELHGGTVTAESAGEGKGSEFLVRLPLSAGATLPTVAAAAPRAAARRRILIVEDNRGTAQVLARLLSKFGDHAIEIAHDGLAAVEAASRHLPEIVLLDLGLPQIHGYEVALRLRDDPRFAGTLMVALTGYGGEEDRRRSIESGFDEHLVKPPSVEDLQRLLAHPKLQAPPVAAAD